MAQSRKTEYLAMILSGVLTVLILCSLAFRDRGVAPTVPEGNRMSIFDMHVNNAVGDALSGIASMKKIYWIPEDTLVAPEPNAALYGQTQDPSTLEWLVKEAEEKVGFNYETANFRTTDDILPGSTVTYYLDETIFAITWKEIGKGSIYTFSEVKVAHPSQFRRFLSGGEYGSPIRYTTSEMASAVNAVVASSGDYYAFRPFGTSVYNGNVYRYGGDRLDTCFVDRNGDLHFVPKKTLLGKDAIDAYVEEKDIQFSLAFGPILLEDGEVVCTNSYAIGETSEKYSRAALCQTGQLQYVLVTSNMEFPHLYNPTITEFAQWLRREGIDKAYALDGGQTAAIIMNDQVINSVDFGQQRQVSDILYFATALPSQGG